MARWKLAHVGVFLLGNALILIAVSSGDAGDPNAERLSFGGLAVMLAVLASYGWRKWVDRSKAARTIVSESINAA